MYNEGGGTAIMNKITRMLLLYQRLMRGEWINKSAYAMEFEIDERSFDRDIQDMRLFLSESFSGMELIYDGIQNAYYLVNLNLKREISIGECYVLSKLLLDSRPLRTDDQSEVLAILLSQISPTARERVLPVLRHTPELPTNLEKTSMKLVEDFLFSIERKQRVMLHFRDRISDVYCVPYSIEFRGRTSFLTAWTIDPGEATLYPLERIISYTPGQPYFLSRNETAALQRLVELVCSESDEGFQSYIFNKECD